MAVQAHEIETGTAETWLAAGTIRVHETGAENTYYTDELGARFFCKNYPDTIYEDPRRVGQVWHSDYWGMFYTVEAVHGSDGAGGHWLTVRWDDGATTTHCTSVGRDRLMEAA